MDKYLIVDADSMLYSSVTCSKEVSEDCFVHDAGVAISRFDEKFMQIVTVLWEVYEIDVTAYVFIIGGENNFRKLLYPSYKSNRPPKPPLLGFLSSYIEKEYGAFRGHGLEADDIVISLHKKLISEGKNVIIATIDKDIKQEPCQYFDYYYQRMSLETVTESQARYNFWSQVLIGDSGDCVSGIVGYGKGKPPKIFKDCVSDFQYLRRTFVEYKKKYKQKAREKMIETYLLVKMRTDVKFNAEFNEI